MGKPRRENDPARRGGPWPTPIGMGALVGYGDFERAHKRKLEHQEEEQAFESGGMDAVIKLRESRPKE